MPDNAGPGDTEELDEDDELATRPHRKLELFEDTQDEGSEFENQLTPPPKFLNTPPEPAEDETRPHVLDDEDEVG